MSYCRYYSGTTSSQIGALSSRVDVLEKKLDRLLAIFEVVAEDVREMRARQEPQKIAPDKKGAHPTQS